MATHVEEIRLSQIADEARDYIDEVPSLAPGDEPAPIIVERVGDSLSIVDGFHRAAGLLRWCTEEAVQADATTVTVIVAEEPALVAAAANTTYPRRQAEAIEEIYRLAGVTD